MSDCKTCLYSYTENGKLRCNNVDIDDTWYDDLSGTEGENCSEYECYHDDVQANREGGSTRLLAINDCTHCSELRVTKGSEYICALKSGVKATWNEGIPDDCPLSASDNHVVKLNHFVKKGVNQTLDCF